MALTKYCSRCKSIKAAALFSRCTRERDGLQSWCKECQKDHVRSPDGSRTEYHRRRYHENKEVYLDSTYKRMYGISLEDYNNMATAQNHVCAICNKTCVSGRRLAVDHNHETGKVRSLLCSNCNKGLGSFKDNPALIQKAIEYLEFHNGA